jgi:aryl-alcohol dehydrogenase-like predicted oxidoreductase
MKYRPFGNSGITGSSVGFGVWTVSTTMWGIKDEGVGIDLLRKAYDLGVTFYDTADVYGDGMGETILAKALGNRRDELVIASKFGYDFYNHPGLQPGQRERPHDWSPAFVRKACEESLKRLNTDHIDLYQLHNPRIDAIQKDDLWAELEAMKSEGKIRMIGAALGPALKPDRQCEEGVVAVKERRCALQIIYNLLEQPIGQAVFPVAREAQVPVFTRVPHASDILSGLVKEDTTFAEDDHRKHRVPTDEAKKRWQDDGLKKAAKIGFLTESGQRTIGQAAIQFILSEPSIGSVLPNIYDEETLRDYAAASDTPPLTEEELSQLHTLYANNFFLDAEPAAA